MDRPPDFQMLPTEAGIRDYLRIISARRWWLICVVTVVTTLTAIYNFKLPNIYQAASTIQINREAPSVVDVKEVLNAQAQAAEFLKTQHKVLGSRMIAERVIKKLDLETNPEFSGEGRPEGLLDRVKRMLLGGEAGSSEKDWAKIYYDHVSINPMPLTLLVSVSAIFEDKKLTAAVANAHAESYLAYTLDQRLGATGEATDWLQHQSEELQVKLDKSEAALQAYREKHGMVSLEDRQNIVVDKLKQLNEQVTKLKGERMVAENNYNQLMTMREKGGDPTTLPFVIQNKVVQDLKSQRMEKASQCAKLQERYLDKHPSLLQARSEAEQVEVLLRLEVEKLLAACETDYHLATNREKNMEQALKEQEIAAMSLNQRQIGYEALKRQADADRQMYQAVLGRMKQTGVSKQLDTSNITILDRAVVPLEKYRPRRVLNILLAFLLSFGVGCSLCVLLESLTETVREPEDLTRNFPMSFLGYIPHRPRSLFRKQGAIADDDAAATVEAFRTALAVLSLQPESAQAACFVVTSATPAEGKTTCAMNLAASFADKGFRTLLIEADLRRPNISKSLGLEGVGGLEKLQLSPSPDPTSLIQATSHPNLSAIVTVTPPPNPHALLSSDVVRHAVVTLKGQFDRVVIDTPPIGAVSDALSLAGLADGVVWVVRFDKVRRKVVMDAFSKLRQVQARVLGFIINDVDLSKRHNKYHYYYHGYDAYYRTGKKT